MSPKDRELARGSINDFAPLCGKMDFTPLPAGTHHSTELTFDSRELLTKDKQAHPMQIISSVSQNTPLENRMEQAKNPVRFWRDSGSDKERKEGSMKQSVPPHSKAVMTAVGADVQRSTLLTYDAIEPLVNQQAPPKQSKSRGWNLAAEAASSGKRIVPKK